MVLCALGAAVIGLEEARLFVQRRSWAHFAGLMTCVALVAFVVFEILSARLS